MPKATNTKSDSDISKATRKDTLKKPIMLQLLSWWRDWKPYFKNRMRQSVSQLWGCLTMALFLVIVLVAILYITVPSRVPGASDMLNSLMLIAVLGLFVVAFLVFLILSLHPKTRKIADRLFGFIDQTELGKLRMKVDDIENTLLSTNKRIDKLDERTIRTDRKLDSVENTLDNIESRLENVGTALTTLANKEKKGDKDG